MGRGERIGSKNNNEGRVRKRNVKSDDSDEDYMLEEDETDNQSDELDSLVGDASDEESLGNFVDEGEEEKVRNVVKPNSCKRSVAQRKNGIKSKRKRKSIDDEEEDEDYEEEEEEDVDADYSYRYGGDTSLGRFVEEVEEESEMNVVWTKTHKRTAGRRKSGIGSSRKREMIAYDKEDDEGFGEEDKDVDADSISGGCANLGSFLDEEEEENVRKPEPCNRSFGRKENGTKSSRKRKRIVEDEDYCEEESNDVDAESIGAGVGVLCAADSGDRGSDNDDDEEEDYEDDGDDDDDDDEFTPEELDFLDEEELNLSPKGKRGSVRSRNRKTGVKRLKKPQKNQRQGSSISNKSTSSRKSVKKVPPARGKWKRTSIYSRKRTKPCSDSDFALSEPSEHEFTISEEEREQVREANEFCRRSSNSRSSKQDQEDAAGNQLKKIPRRKGKEKVEEVKSDLGKQVCGICLTEEGKNTIRGTLDCCSHFFCFPCIMEWSKVESRCPLCKQRFYTISKSSRTSTRIDLRNVVIHVPERDQVYQPSEEELRDYLESYENVFCTECHDGGDDALMLLCDLCNSPSHTYCVGLGRNVPDGNWYCLGCRPSALGSTATQAEDLTPTQRSNSNSITEPLFENMSEIDLNITIPETPMTPVNEFLVSPRQPSGVTLQAPSPVSTVGVSTLSGRRRVHRLQYLFSSNRLSQEAMRLDRSFSFGRNNFSGPHDNRDVNSSYSAEYSDRLPENPFTSAQNRESITGRLSLMRGQPQSFQAPPVADNSAYGINVEHNCVPGNVTLQPCTSTSSLVDQNVVEQQLHSLVKTHLKNLCRDINLDLGQDIFKKITVNSTHTILAASGLAYSRTEVHEIQPPNCGHSEGLVGLQTSLIRNCCQACFDSFVREVVMTITMNFRAKAAEQSNFRNY